MMVGTRLVTPVSTIFSATLARPVRYMSSLPSYTEKSKPYAPLIWMSMRPGLLGCEHRISEELNRMVPQDVATEVDDPCRALLASEEGALEERSVHAESRRTRKRNT
jgi:hypothetical protein